MTAPLARRLGLPGATGVGVSAMVGAGLFVAFGPAAAASGDGLLAALLLAAMVAACNAVSSARLARRLAVSGGTYVYGRERLGPFWGHLAGWSFIVGKLASCAAMALAVGSYAWPDHARGVAVVIVALVTLVNLAGVQKSAVAGIVVVTVVLAVTAACVITMLSGPAAPGGEDTSGSPSGILQGAGLLFFAFAGYARLATLGEEVRRPETTIGRAIALAVTLVVLVYAAVAVALVRTLGTAGLAGSSRPFVTALETAGAERLVPAIVAAAALAAGGALLSLMLGVSRTVLAMARDGHLPRALAAVSPRTHVPHRAELAVAAVVVVALLRGGLAESIAFSSFCVLVYYAVTNAAALTLPGRASSRVLPSLGLAGCLTLATTLPAVGVVGGLVVLVSGAALFALTRAR
jgi:APA family basic amino acid/polyamine antiporter